MLVAIHQPNFLPWLGYLDRMAKADVFVILDHVQFERRNYQNRTQILLEGESRWLTVPVVQLSQKEKIIDKRVDNSETGSRQWGPNHFKTLRYAYRKAPYFELYAPKLQSILETPWDRLVDLNMATLTFLREAYDIRTPLVLSSDMKPEGARSELLLDICRRISPQSTFLGGLGGSRRYLDQAAFAGAGIGVQWQELKHPVYPQCHGGEFIPGLTSLDLLFNLGPEAARAHLHGIAPKLDERVAA